VLAPLYLLSVSTAGPPHSIIYRRIMSDFIKSQMDARNNLIAQAREVLDIAEAEKRGLSAEENQKIARIEADIEQADTAISTARNIAEREARAAEAASAFTPAPSAPVNSDADILRSIANGEMRGHEFGREARTLVPSANTVGQSFFDQVFEIAQLVGPMLTVSEVFNTTSGENLVIPTVTATSTSGSVAAAGTIATSNPTFSSITLGATKYASLVSVSNELVADAGFNITSYLAQQLGTSLGLAANSAMTTKLSAAAGSVVRGTATNFAAEYEDLIDLVYGIADGARVLPGLGFQMSKTGIAAARKLKDGSGAYIWTDSAVPGQPATLLGYPVFENPNVSAVGTAAKSVLFGHLPSFKIRVAGGVRVDQSSDFAFNTDTTTYRGIIRLDGGLTHASHIGFFQGK
jgi:HK97 family phage major capsid protein